MRIIGTKTFDTGCTRREQALKVLEEAAELVEAVKNAEQFCWLDSEAVKMAEEEAADVVQAVLNLFGMMGYDREGVELAMSECMERNRERGRYAKAREVTERRESCMTCAHWLPDQHGGRFCAFWCRSDEVCPPLGYCHHWEPMRHE